MNNQEGMLAAVSALGGRGASRPLCPSTPISLGTWHPGTRPPRTDMAPQSLPGWGTTHGPTGKPCCSHAIRHGEAEAKGWG